MLTPTAVQIRLAKVAHPPLAAWMAKRSHNLGMTIWAAIDSITPKPVVKEVIQAIEEVHKRWKDQASKANSYTFPTGSTSIEVRGPDAARTDKYAAQVIAALTAADFGVERVKGWTPLIAALKVTPTIGRVEATKHAAIMRLADAHPLPLPLQMDPKALQLKHAVVHIYGGEYLVRAASEIKTAGVKTYSASGDTAYRVPMSVPLPANYHLQEFSFSTPPTTGWEPFPSFGMVDDIVDAFSSTSSSMYGLNTAYWGSQYGQGLLAATDGSQLMVVRVSQAPSGAGLCRMTGQRGQIIATQVMGSFARVVTPSTYSTPPGFPDFWQVLGSSGAPIKIPFTLYQGKAWMAALRGVHADTLAVLKPDGRMQLVPREWVPKGKGKDIVTHWKAAEDTGIQVDYDGPQMAWDAKRLYKSLAAIVKLKVPKWYWRLPDRDQTAPTVFCDVPAGFEDWTFINVIMPIRPD